MKIIISLLFVMSCVACSQKNESTKFNLKSPTNQAVIVPTNSLPKPTATPKANTAIVTSPHANLRDADNASATVIRVVPQDAAVEVVKQQGAWYLVKTETEQGWMHGNTLKLHSFDINPNPPPSLKQIDSPKPVEPPSETTDLRIKGNRNSMIYHLPGCASYDKISAGNIVWFRTKEEAEKAGYRMARNC